MRRPGVWGGAAREEESALTALFLTSTYEILVIFSSNTTENR